MLRIWGKLYKNNKIIKNEVSISDVVKDYNENLNDCITDLCYKMDIERPYWLKRNIDEYIRRNKTIFDENNFINKIDFDRFIIEELKEEKKKK
ncbi:MAG: hypothetical protein Q8900_06585 [Bacillota bacterium]|nr:hypothetical protein [Bacillota bacterium]